MRRPLALLCLVPLCAYAVGAYRIARSRTDPEASRGSILAATGRDLERAAEQRIEDALQALRAEQGATPRGLDAYRTDLAAAEDLLVRSLRARPSNPRALARLAAVRWEIGAPYPGGSPAGPLAMISLASRTAPDAPTVELLLGELLLVMGEREAAPRHLHRAVLLDPETAPKAVQDLRNSFFTGEEILEALPRTPRVLIAAQKAFFDDADEARYLAIVENELASAGADLLRAYADACLHADDPGRLLATLATLPQSPETAAEILLQSSRARFARGEIATSLEEIRRARQLRPEEPRILEHLGNVALASQDPAEALLAYRAALGLVARGAGTPALRARLYREIGVAEERAGRGDRAFDAYRKALELNPQDAGAARRIEAMEHEAGLIESGPKEAAR